MGSPDSHACVESFWTQASFQAREETQQEGDMKKFMLLHFGFEKPTPEIMAAWNKWFESVADKTVEKGGFHGGAR